MADAFPRWLRLGTALFYAVVTAGVGLVFLDGVVRTMTLVMAVVGAVVANELLKRISPEEARKM